MDTRTSILLLALCFALTACGNRTPLELPKPTVKPPAPAQSNSK